MEKHVLRQYAVEFGLGFMGIVFYGVLHNLKTPEITQTRFCILFLCHALRIHNRWTLKINSNSSSTLPLGKASLCAAGSLKYPMSRSW